MPDGSRSVERVRKIGSRPSAGAATCEYQKAQKFPKTLLRTDVAAPEDGRTPTDFRSPPGVWNLQLMSSAPDLSQAAFECRTLWKAVCQSALRIFSQWPGFSRT